VATGGGGPALRADDVHVLYAGDVGQWRVALTETPAREGTGRTQWWSVGDRGASADTMTTWWGNPARDLAWLWWGPTLDGTPVAGNAPTDHGVLVVVSARPGTVSLAGNPTFRADGSVRFPQRALPSVAPGVVEDVVPMAAGSQLWLALPQQPEQPRTWMELAGPRVPADDALLRGLLPAVHGGARPDPEDLLHRDVLPAMQARSGQDVRSSERRLLWSGRMGGWTTHVVAITTRGGANLVFTSRVKAGEERSGRFSHRNQEAIALPAGPLDRIAYAWVFGSPDDVRTPPTHVGVLAPDAAVTAELTTSGRSGPRVRLSGGVGTLELDGADPERAKVTLRDAGGAVVATVPVTGDTEHGLEPPAR
jgi:hypothetical protein